MHYYEKKLERKVPETTVHQFRNLYHIALKRRLDETNDSEIHVNVLPKKRRG